MKLVQPCCGGAHAGTGHGMRSLVGGVAGPVILSHVTPVVAPLVQYVLKSASARDLNSASVVWHFCCASRAFT